MLSVRVCIPPLADAAQQAYVTPSQRALLDALPAWQTGATVLEETPADWGAAIEAPVRLCVARTCKHALSPRYVNPHVLRLARQPQTAAAPPRFTAYMDAQELPAWGDAPPVANAGSDSATRAAVAAQAQQADAAAPVPLAAVAPQPSPQRGCVRLFAATAGGGGH